MLVGVMTAQMYMQGVTSLKQKRSIVKGVIGRLRSRFNISASEVEHQDNNASISRPPRSSTRTTKPAPSSASPWSPTRPGSSTSSSTPS